MMTTNPDFGAPFTSEESSEVLGPVITIDPVLIGVAFIAGVIFILVAAAAVMIGRQRGIKAIIEQRDSSAKAIYEHIEYALNEALMAQGIARIDKARELKDILDARLGPLMAFNEKHLKAFKTLKKSLEPPSDEAQKADAPPKPPEIKVAVGAEELSLVIWKALQNFKSVWGNRAHIVGLIRAAQDEMIRDPSPKIAKPVQTVSSPKAGTSAARPVSEKKTAATSLDETPPTPPAPAPSNGKKGKKLPAHKRNMLA